MRKNEKRSKLQIDELMFNKFYGADQHCPRFGAFCHKSFVLQQISGFHVLGGDGISFESLVRLVRMKAGLSKMLSVFSTSPISNRPVVIGDY